MEGALRATLSGLESDAAAKLDFPKDDLERQEATDPFFPRRTNPFLDAEKAVQFYRSTCTKFKLQINHSFVKYLRSGSAIMEFDNGYLGENGIIPIMSTLKHFRILKLLLPKCMLDDEDIKLICDTFYHHPTLETLDFRGNKISVSGAKNILRLLLKNKRITEVLLDPETPKFANIVNQASQNGSAELRSSSCLCCDHPVVYSLAENVEFRFLQTLLNNFQLTIDRISKVQVEVLFRLVLFCCEARNGVLSLCSDKCLDLLCRDLYECLGLVTRACDLNLPYDLSKSHPLLRQCLPGIIAELNSRPLTQKDYQGEDSDSSDNVENFLDDALEKKEGLHEECSVCGQKGKCFRNGFAMMAKQLMQELDRNVEICSSSLLRLCHVMISQVNVQPCSRKCVRQLLRFGITGFYGVIRAFPQAHQMQLLSKCGVSTQFLPATNFSVVNFSDVVVDHLHEEEITCALTVASAMEDIDSVPIDPYFIFAIGRHICHQNIGTIGMELQGACEAVHLVGCLPQCEAPFNRRAGDRPPRRFYANWEDWCKLGNVEHFLHCAFARRRVSVFAVDGPHGNMFDNVRGALWAFRYQRRSVVLTMKFSCSWLVEKSGVISETSSARGGFYTTVKVVGQTSINNSLFLIIQGNFGPSTGQKGFFYVPKSVLNRHYVHNAYIFVDLPPSTERANVSALYASKLIGPSPLATVSVAERYGDFFSLLSLSSRFYPFHKEKMKRFGQFLENCSPSLAFLFSRAALPSGVQQEWLRYFYLLVHCSPLISQLAHFFNEICPIDTSIFIHELFSSEKSPCLPAELCSRLLKWNGKEKKTVDVGSLEWYTLKPENLAGASAMDLKAFIKKKKKKVVKQGRRLAVREMELSNGSLKGPSHAEEYLEAAWKSEKERLDRLAQKGGIQHYAAESLLPYACSHKVSNLLVQKREEDGFTGSTSSPMDSQCDDSLEASLIGCSWNLVHIIENEFGSPSHLLVAIIQDKACLYDLDMQKVVVPLCPLSSMELFSRFPFRSGFDSCFHHPLFKRYAYFFCNHSWVEWDAVKHRCLRGPFDIKTHPLFENLPAQFHQRIEAAIPIVGTPYVVFCAQKSFIVFNIEKKKPEGEPQLVVEANFAKGTDSSVDPTLSAVFNGMSALWCADHREVMTSYFPMAPHKNSCVMIVFANGELTEGNFSSSNASSIKIPISNSPLHQLPLAFRQSTTKAIPYLCDLVMSEYLKASSKVRLEKLTRFDSDFYHKRLLEKVEIHSSNLKRTSVADHYPNSLHSITSMTKRSSLLSDVVHFFGNGAVPEDRKDYSAGTYIEYDFGSSQCIGFSAVVLFLDVSQVNRQLLELSPPTIVVESSMDKVAFQTHCTFRASRFVSEALWPESHMGRFWRLRFLDPVPTEMGVVKVFWHKAKYSTVHSPLPVLESFTPLLGKAKITVGAEVVMRPAEDLCWGSPLGGTVFACSTTVGWYEKHAVLPILPMGDTCLFFCGETFAELDMATNEVVGGRSYLLSEHPCFSTLPVPFNRGFDALFYPNEENPSVVVIIRDGYELSWNLVTGMAASSVERCENQSFQGINIDMASIYAVLNVWGQPGEVDVVFVMDNDHRGGVLRWNALKQVVVDLPLPLREVPALYHSRFDEKPLLCLFSIPRNPNSVFVFSDALVANNRLFSSAVEARACSSFFRLAWVLPKWMKKQEECFVQVDFMAELPLILGVAFVMSSPGDPRSPWKIEFSDDSMRWTSVGVDHFQDNPYSETTWLPRHVENQSHRFWRFSLSLEVDRSYSTPSPSAILSKWHVAVKSISFLTLPSFAFHPPFLAPLSISSSASKGVENLFDADKSITFPAEHLSSTVEKRVYSRESLILPVHHITLDYHHAAMHLVSFGCDTLHQSGSDQWYVYCSDDGTAWHSLANGCGMHGHIRMSWAAGRSFRFWRFEFQADGPREFRYFTVYGYKGPCIGLSTAKCSISPRQCASLIPLLYSSRGDEAMEKEQDSIRFETYSGAVIALDTKAERTSVIGVKLLCSFATAKQVEFMVEYSNDAVWWYEKTRFCFVGDTLESSMVWNSVGSHRFWRLRVLSSSGGFLLLHKVFFSVSNSQLYHTHLSPAPGRGHRNEKASEVVYYTFPQPIRFVRMETELPPNTVYAVEKLTQDGSSWEVVKQIENTDLHHPHVVDEGWEGVTPSTSWRMRFLAFLNPDVEPVEPSFPPLHLPVQWFAFTNRRLERVRCEDLPNLEITFHRFTQVNALDALHHNGDFAILEMDDTAPAVPQRDHKKAAVENEETEGERETAKKENGRGKALRSSKAEMKKEEQKKRNDQHKRNVIKELQIEKEKKEIEECKWTSPKIEDPHILYSFPYPARLHQVYIYGVVTKKVITSPEENISNTACSSFMLSDTASHESMNVTPREKEAEEKEVCSTNARPDLRITAVVEISDNGADFMVVARSVILSDFITLAWNGEESSLHWRIRFEKAATAGQLLVYSIKWFTFQGVASKYVPLDPFYVSNPTYAWQKREAFHCTDELVTNCRLGIDQVKSCANKLREEFDVDKVGEIAGNVVGRKKAYQVFWAKLSKAAVRNPQVPEGLFFGSASTLAKDLNFFLFRTSQKFQDSSFYALTQMVQSPLVFADWKINKKESSWFYPSFEITGTLLNDIFHFRSVTTSFIVLWSLSASVQRNFSLLNDSTISCVGDHLASPLIAMSIDSDQWTSEEHFPLMPFLNHAGFTNRPMTIIFSITTLSFTEQYSIRSPLRGSSLSSQPFRVASGVNFFRHGTVSSCLSPIFSLLENIYQGTFLQTYSTPIVLSVSSLRARDGRVCFTLPAKKINFGMDGLEIGTLEFEVTMFMIGQAPPAPVEEDENGSTPAILCGECEYQVSFVTHGATFQIQTSSGVSRIPVAISGSFDGKGSPVIQIQGISLSCNIPLFGIRGSTLTALKFSCVVSAGEEPQSFTVPHILVSGSLALSSRTIISCHYSLVQNSFLNRIDTLHLDIWEMTLDDLLAVSQWLKCASTELPVGGRDRGVAIQKEHSISHVLPCFIYTSLELNLTEYKLFGTGELKIGSEFTDTADFIVEGSGFRIVSTMGAFQCGIVKFKSPPVERKEKSGGVLMEISACLMDGVKPDVNVEVFGVSDFFFPKAETKVHISRQGCICVCSTPYFVLTSEENCTEPTCSSATVSVCGTTLMNKIVYHLKNAPMIIALLAHGLPFCFSNENLTVAPFHAANKKLSLNLCGVLFGNYFEVMSDFFYPAQESVSYDELCEILVLRAIEASQEMIWVSYGSVVGCLVTTNTQPSSGSKEKDEGETTTDHRTFFSRWSLKKKKKVSLIE